MDTLPSSPASQQDSQAWYLAVQRHVATLSDTQRAAFHAPASAETCLNMIIQAQGRKRRLTRLLGLIRPLIEPLQRFEGAIDVLMQTHGAVASPIWGPLRMAITLASDYFKTLENLAMILDRVVSSLERCVNYEKLFETNSAVQKAIGILYSDLIDFCTRVVRFYSKSSLRAMFVSFDTEFQEVSEHINLHSTELDWVANVANIADGQKGRAESDNARMSQMRSNIQRWLSPSNVQDDLHRRSLEYMPGSCDWVWDTSQAQTFFASSISTSMIIQGRPGSGKTYLSSFIIQSLMKREEQVVLYFFCQAGDPEKREITCILRTILSQLLLVDQSLYKTLDPLYTRSGRTKADSYVEVYDAIFLALSKVKETKLVVVIDALDECQKCEDLVQALFGFQERVQSGMSLIFTSRQMPLAFPFGERLMFEQETSNIPIRQYIEHRVFQMETIPNKALKANVVQQISIAADGLWLYARLMLDEVQKLPSTILIERHLSKIPHGLTQLYTQIFRSKEANFTEAHIRFAQHLFVWMDTTEFMPAWFALDCLPYEMICLVFQCVNFGEPVFDPAALMTELCSPVLEAVRLPLGPAESYIHGELDSAPRYKIEFVHHTAYQYLRACQDLDAAELAVVLRPRRLRELYRGVTAVWYFTECEISKSHLYISPDDIGDLHTCGCYFEMSYGLRSALTLKRLPNDLYGKEQAEAENMLHVLTRFISEDSEQCLRWVEGGIVINYAAGWRHLQDKAEEALEAVLASKHSSKLPAFDIFQATREAFHRDYVYVLQLTGPNCDDREAEPTMPKGFQNRPLALKMLNIGKRWQHLHQYREENYTTFRELAVNF